ncbi:MAG: C10 family peptidase, partial [Bacteroidales bacterium]|nr:C10 family peptidase [Bacteroidales bacterium]
MKIKIFTTILISVFFNLILFAGEVSVDKARQVAKNLYFQKSDINYNEIIFDKDFTIYEGNTLVYYVFNISNENGFVIVSAEDHVLPILGYSFEGNYYENNQPPQFISWMQNYKEQILFVKENNLPASEEIIFLWEKYETRTEKDNGFYENRTIVGPLLGDIKWDQGCLYNDSCPADASGPCGHAYAGCVATATGMIMKYHHHPHQGVGSNSYFNATYGTLSADFGSTTYDWANMPVSGSNEDVALILYHVGVSVNMNYGPTGSSANTSAAVTALKTYFEYKTSAFYDQKVYHTPQVWNNMLITELDNDRPLLYRGYGTGGHAFVCDGYDDDYQSTGTLYFHFNWGW